MKIADYTLAMQSSHQFSQQSSASESLRAWVDPPAAPPPSPTVSISADARQKQANDVAALDQAQQNVVNDPKLQLLIQVIEKLTGKKVRVFDASQLQNVQTAVAADPRTAPTAPARPRAGFGIDYSKTVSYSESEQTTLQASGVIHTTDGKEIRFSLDLSMQRQYSETSSTRIQVGDATRKTDPLVINFNGTAAQLTDQRFAFDLNSDGTNEQINFTRPGSGFLVLDKNGNGKVDNGSELFGPASGNGYGELAQYDSDHNGWIDENDAAFRQLKVWSKDAAGNDSLQSLAALGIGAISLQSVATPFDIRNASNQTLGSVKSGSVVLNEDGSVSSMQQIDLTA